MWAVAGLLPSRFHPTPFPGSSNLEKCFNNVRGGTFAVISGRHTPASTKVCQPLTNCDPDRANFGRSRPKLAFGRHRPKSARVGPTLVKIWPLVVESCSSIVTGSVPRLARRGAIWRAMSEHFFAMHAARRGSILFSICFACFRGSSLGVGGNPGDITLRI